MTDAERDVKRIMEEMTRRDLEKRRAGKGKS